MFLKVFVVILLVSLTKSVPKLIFVSKLKTEGQRKILC